jgi:WD40 repeat protein
MIVCADNDIHLLSVYLSKSTDKLNLKLIKTFNCHDKIVNMCCMVNQYKVATCSREPIIKIFDLENDSTPTVQLIGHEMPVSSISYRNGKIVSGGRDCTTRVWDIET